MLNGDLKKEAIERLQSAQARYKKNVEQVQKRSEQLFSLRQRSSHDVIGQVEAYINTLANSPKEFDRSFAAYKAEFKTFTEMIRQLEIEAADIDFKAGTSAAAGVAAGVGTAALGPSALMAVATTFGTASTGTAISTLGGAAATKAALAWLGGGALATGGGGMAGGSALIALTGPVGWAIGGAALVGSGLFARSKNRKIAEEATANRKIIETHDAQMKAALHEVGRMIDLTEQHVAGVMNLLQVLSVSAPTDYRSFRPEHKEQLGALINHIRGLSELLNMKVDPSGERPATNANLPSSGGRTVGAAVGAGLAGVAQAAKVNDKPSAEPVSVYAPRSEEGVREVQIRLWTKEVGEPVQAGEMIALAWIDYDSFEVQAPVDGVLISVVEDDVVITGSPIAQIQPAS